VLLPVAVILAVAIGTVQGAQWIVEGRVVGISDGDTITVLDADKKQHKIRINGIDAPEKGQAFRRAVETESRRAGARSASRRALP
jgi:endonuclease YncB( thermonuclease family)